MKEQADMILKAWTDYVLRVDQILSEMPPDPPKAAPESAAKPSIDFKLKLEALLERKRSFWEGAHDLLK